MGEKKQNVGLELPKKERQGKGTVQQRQQQHRAGINTAARHVLQVEHV